MPTIRRWSVTVATGLGLTGAAMLLITSSVSLGADHCPVGSASQRICDVQTILQRAGYLAPGDYRGGEDDAATRTALRSFQTHHHLSPTGSVDYETMTQISSHAGTLDREGAAATTRASLLQGGRSLAPEGITFDSGTAHLTPGSRVTLDRVARSLVSSPDARVAVNGYTDSRNTEAYNLSLSRARSSAVCEYLVNQGVDSSRLKEKGFGESHPIADNTTAAGRATNRRVEIVRVD
jgi:outer membrane protein OmpA-like peptidoglycan-associated protein